MCLNHWIRCLMDLVGEVMEVKVGEELMSLLFSAIWAFCLVVWVVVG